VRTDAPDFLLSFPCGSTLELAGGGGKLQVNRREVRAKNHNGFESKKGGGIALIFS